MDTTYTPKAQEPITGWSRYTQRWGTHVEFGRDHEAMDEHGLAASVHGHLYHPATAELAAKKGRRYQLWMAWRVERWDHESRTWGEIDSGLAASLGEARSAAMAVLEAVRAGTYRGPDVRRDLEERIAAWTRQAQELRRQAQGYADLNVESLAAKYHQRSQEAFDKAEELRAELSTLDGIEATQMPDPDEERPAAKPVHYQDTASSVACRIPARRWDQDSNESSWDMGNITADWSRTTCPACLEVRYAQTSRTGDAERAVEARRHAAGEHSDGDDPGSANCPTCQKEERLVTEAKAHGDALLADAQAQALYEVRERLSHALAIGQAGTAWDRTVMGLEQAIRVVDVAIGELPIRRRRAGEMTVAPALDADSDTIVVAARSYEAALDQAMERAKGLGMALVDTVHRLGRQDDQGRDLWEAVAIGSVVEPRSSEPWDVGECGPVGGEA